jgi:hypothetical protein
LPTIKELIVCCPNDPDDAKFLSDVAGTQIGEAFIGSCMTNNGHFRAAAKLLGGQRDIPVKLWVAPPTKMDESELIKEGHYERIAALVPPPRTHRHRYFGVLAPNSPHRAAVVSLAQGAVVQPAQVQVQVQAEPVSSGVGTPGAGNAPPTQAVPAQPVQPKRPAHYLWAALIARIYEVLALLCPLCGGQMRIIAGGRWCRGCRR